MKYSGVVRARLCIDDCWDEIIFDLITDVIYYCGDKIEGFSKEAIIDTIKHYEDKGVIIFHDQLKPTKELKRVTL